MRESEKKVFKRFLKTKEVLRRAKTGVLNRDAAADLGKSFYLKSITLDLGIKTF